MKIVQFPFTRITIGFILGVFSAYFLKPSPFLTFGLLFFGFILLFVFYLFTKKNQNARILFGISTFLLSLFTGITSTVIHNNTHHLNHYVNQIKDYDKEHEFEIILSERLKNTPKNYRYAAEIKKIDNVKSCGKIILNLNKENTKNILELGTWLKMRGIIYKVRKPVNPGQFDYSRYLENQSIYAQVYSNSDQILFGRKENTFFYSIANLRNRISRNLEKSKFKKEELSIVNALVLGQRQDISPEVLKDFQYAGAIHILSVSGLHIGIILLFITFLLKPIPNSKKGALIKLFITILCLWLYGILAGLSPSIVRSVTMFSFVAVGIHFRRTLNFYHTLLVSVLIILLFKPSFLFEVGFQLSYLALFFIVWFQPVLANIWKPKNKIINYLWSIITVSFAAQIGTMPLSIYYFHQFPGLFFLTNIAIIPMLSFILGLGLVVTILAGFNLTPLYLLNLLELLISLLNKIIHWVASFESFIIKNISFNFQMLIGAYLLIVLGIIWLKKPVYKRLIPALTSCIIFQLVLLSNKYSIKNSNETLVFHLKKNTLILDRRGNDVSIFSSDSILKNSDNNPTLQSYLVENFSMIKKKKNIPNVLYLNKTKIMVVDSSSIYIEYLNPDIILLTQSPKINLQRVFKQWKPKKVVCDGSNYKTYVKLWEQTCRKEKIPFHNTNEKGFYKF
jgi:competence protein ComEC